MERSNEYELRIIHGEPQKLNILPKLMQKFLYPKVLSKLNYSCFINKLIALSKLRILMNPQNCALC